MANSRGLTPFIWSQHFCLHIWASDSKQEDMSKQKCSKWSDGHEALDWYWNWIPVFGKSWRYLDFVHSVGHIPVDHQSQRHTFIQVCNRNASDCLAKEQILESPLDLNRVYSFFEVVWVRYLFSIYFPVNLSQNRHLKIRTWRLWLFSHKVVVR